MDLIAETCDRVTRPVMPPRVAAAEHHADRLPEVRERLRAALIAERLS